VNIEKVNTKDISSLSIGISDFREMVVDKSILVDKTLLIKEVIEDRAKVILITRPRRFGKTLNLSMLYYFLKSHLSEEYNIFENLKISVHEEFCLQHQNKYPVIFISFKDVKASKFEKAYADILGLFSNLYSEHRYLLEGDLLNEDEKQMFNAILYRKAEQSIIEESIQKLSEFLDRKFGKSPIILIDEYDTPIQSAYLNNHYDEMIELMRGVLGSSLKDNRYLSKAILTGITRIAQESLFSGVNNFEAYSLLREKYGQYFGFTEDEVVRLKNEVGEVGNLVSMADIKDWYNGYRIGKYTLYNPWSIISCLRHNGALAPYWLNTASNGLIALLLSKAKMEVKYQFEKLLQKEEVEQPLIENLVFPDLKNKEGALWSLLLHAGYLNVLSTHYKGHLLLATIAIPNKEVMFVYDEIIEQRFSSAVSLASYTSLTESLANGNTELFKRRLGEYLIESGSYFDFNINTPESIFQAFVLGFIVGLKDDYIINSNREAGLGRFDVILIPKNKEKQGILLEFKTAETIEELPAKAEEALLQIKDKEYFRIFKQHEIAKVLAIGLAFCGKKLELRPEHIET
ncbi:MAG: AAA family ATPase, partial [Alphaproteobacteria bacterium]|nr:AAA family ATPase [Alphaproteobacteria bacterium]